ncbi:MAG: isoprenylcysteine carboxyl methyltransferase family protein [Caulobacteraceae bacterium]
MTPSIIVLALVTAQRLGELVLAARNTRRLLAKGGREVDAGHYPLLVLLHAAWLAGLWLLAWDRPVRWPWVALFLVLQGLRLWVIATLGERWTTRIVVLPDAPLVRRGPYRFFSHPNYAVVAAEIAVLPLAFGLVLYAAAFSLLNAGVLAIRLRAETRALAGGQRQSANGTAAHGP